MDYQIKNRARKESFQGTAEHYEARLARRARDGKFGNLDPKLENYQLMIKGTSLDAG